MWQPMPEILSSSGKEPDSDHPSSRIQNMSQCVFRLFVRIDVSGKTVTTSKGKKFQTIWKTFTKMAWCEYNFRSKYVMKLLCNGQYFATFFSDRKRMRQMTSSIIWQQRLSGKRQRPTIMLTTQKPLKLMAIILMLQEFQVDWLKLRTISIRYKNWEILYIQTNFNHKWFLENVNLIIMFQDVS